MEYKSVESGTKFFLPKSCLRSEYIGHPFKECRIEAGKKLGYSGVRIAVNEIVRGLEEKMYDWLLYPKPSNFPPYKRD